MTSVSSAPVAPRRASSGRSRRRREALWILEVDGGLAGEVEKKGVPFLGHGPERCLWRQSFEDSCVRRSTPTGWPI